MCGVELWGLGRMAVGDCTGEEWGWTTAEVIRTAWVTSIA
jgi:hypothetical protein